MPTRVPINVFDFTSAEFIENPYPVYARLRNEFPVCWDERLGFWVVSRFEDVHPLLRSKRWSSDQLNELMDRLTPMEQVEASPLKEILTNRLVLSDNPDHARVRGLMQQAFTPRRVDLMRPAIETIASELLDSFAPGQRVDLIADFADPLAARGIAHMLGLPSEDRLRFKNWTDDIYAFFSISAEPVSARARRGTASALELRDYLEKLFADRRRKPRDDLLTAMVLAEEQGERLTQTELYSNVVGMLNASHETTTNLIGNTVVRPCSRG